MNHDPDHENDPGSGAASEWDAQLSGYERLTLVGHGGTASVYSATRTADGGHVAVKVFDVAEASHFDRQVRAAERLGDLDGVVPIIDQGTLADGRQYIVAPFVPGGSLSDQLLRFGPMPPERVAALGSRLASTLGGAHAAGVLHRDLKPSNVLLDDTDSPLLADFGAAGITDPATASETLAITIAYAAPEVLEGAPASERSDVYSLGLTLLTLSSGSHPFGGPTTGLASLVNEICTKGAPDPTALGLPEGLAAVLRRATALDPDDRYTTSERFATALVEARQHLDVPPADSSAPGGSAAGPRTSRRGRTIMAVASVAALIAGGAAWAVFADDDKGSATTLVASGSAPTEADVDPVTDLDPVTEANGVLGPLYEQDDFAYGGRLAEECSEDDTRVALAIHAAQADRLAGVAEPWNAVLTPEAGTFMAYLPCESGGDGVRYVLRAPGRWFTVVAQFPQDQYDRMVEWMRENETSPAPDYTVDDPIRATLADSANYEGWAIIDRAE